MPTVTSSLNVLIAFWSAHCNRMHFTRTSLSDERIQPLPSVISYPVEVDMIWKMIANHRPCWMQRNRRRTREWFIYKLASSNEEEISVWLNIMRRRRCIRGAIGRWTRSLLSIHIIILFATFTLLFCFISIFIILDDQDCLSSIVDARNCFTYVRIVHFSLAVKW